MPKSKKTSSASKRQKTTHNEPAAKPTVQDIPESSPEAVFQSLIEPIKIEDFFHDYWEKKPLVIEAKEPKTSILNWFSKEKAIELLSKEHLHFLLDVHFCILSEGKTKDLNKEGRVTAKECSRLLDKMKATAQIHQVQRFVDPLWYVMEHLESLFGSLVGSNVYITPQGSQGLAPHYDDVEVFIFQLEGEKHWRLYKPLVQLAREYKANLSSKDIGEPTHEFVLKPGDILYMPRGTIHQADTPVEASSHSTHITISTYQKHSAGDLLELAFPGLIENTIDDCFTIRQGLPIGFFHKTNSSDLTKLLVQSLESLTECVKRSKMKLPRELVEDFMKCRLPPYGFDSETLVESPSVSQPSLASEVRLTYPKHVSYVVTNSPDDYYEEEEEDDDSDEYKGIEDNQEPVLIVYSSIGNSRRYHMIKIDPDESRENGTENHQFTKLRFPVRFEPAVEQLLQTNCFIEVKSLNSLNDEDKLQLVTSLWADHLLDVK